MSATVLASARSRLVELLSTAPGLTGVDIRRDGELEDLRERASVWLGPADVSIEPEALRPGTPRWQHVWNQELMVKSKSRHQTAEAAEAAVLGIADAIEVLVTDNPRLASGGDGGVPGVVRAQPAGIVMDPVERHANTGYSVQAGVSLTIETRSVLG